MDFTGIKNYITSTATQAYENSRTWMKEHPKTTGAIATVALAYLAYNQMPLDCEEILSRLEARSVKPYYFKLYEITSSLKIGKISSTLYGDSSEYCVKGFHPFYEILIIGNERNA